MAHRPGELPQKLSSKHCDRAIDALCRSFIARCFFYISEDRAFFVPSQVVPFVAGVAAQVRHDVRERGGHADAAGEAPHLLRLLRLALGRPRSLAHGLGGQQASARFRIGENN